MNRARYLFAFGYKHYHSMARANLNKSEWLMTNTTKASPEVYASESASIEMTPLSDLTSQN